MGLKLFDRSTRHVLLTQEGERFWLSAQRLAEELEDCAKAMRDTAQLARGHVAVLSEPCITAVAQGEADFALAAIRADTPELQAEPFCRDGFHLVCRDDHPLAQQAEIGVPDLQPWPFVHLARHSSVRQYLDAVLFPQTLRTLVEVEQLATVMGLVQAGLGISVNNAINHQHGYPGVVERPMDPPQLMEIGLACGENLAPAAQAFLEFVKTRMPE